MKKKWIKIIPIVLAALLLSGCFSMPAGGSFNLSAMAEEKLASVAGLDDMAVELKALEFFALYAGYGFYGGYSYETGFEEGAGTRWVYNSVKEDGSLNNSEFERVFLKDMGDGSGWWRMSVESEEDYSEYEYLLSSDSDFLVIRFRDKESGEIIEYIPEQGEDIDDEAEDALQEEDLTEEDLDGMEEENMEEYENLEYSQYSEGTEKITVGAGTFTAEHMVSEYKDDSDPENPVNIRSDWWIAESVPGGVIQYIWTNIEDGSSLNSELDELLTGQETRLDSY